MATDHFSWTVRLAPDELDIDSSDWVVYTLPDVVSEAMGGEDALTTMSTRDELHHRLRQVVRAFGTSTLGFLDRVPDTPDALQAGSDVVSALLPADIPAALEDIEEILHDARRLGPALGIPGLTDDRLAQWRDDAYNGHFADDSDVVWYLQCLAWELQCAQEEGNAVVHVRLAP